MRTVEVLQLGEQIAERLGVPAGATAGGSPSSGRLDERRFPQEVADEALPAGTQRGRVDTDAGRGDARGELVRFEQLVGVRPDSLERGLRAIATLVGAVAEPK